MNPFREPLKQKVEPREILIAEYLDSKRERDISYLIFLVSLFLLGLFSFTGLNAYMQNDSGNTVFLAPAIACLISVRMSAWKHRYHCRIISSYFGQNI